MYTHPCTDEYLHSIDTETMAKLRSILKEWVSFSIYSMRYAVKFLFFPFKTTQEVFSEIYQKNVWGSRESASGSGSEKARSRVVAQRLPDVIRNLGVRSFLDVPCGDFNWMRHVDLAVERYIGADIVDAMVSANSQRYAGPRREFVRLDVICDPLPLVDLIFCRDCLVHLSLKDAMAVIANFKRSRSTYVMLTTFTNCKRNFDMITGGWRALNLQRPPFNFPAPIELINEQFDVWLTSVRGKSMGIWRLSDLDTGAAD